jgi:hypothetical protein
LARHFVDRIGAGKTVETGQPTDPGELFWQVKAEGDSQEKIVSDLRALWGKFPVLGLTAKEGIPEKPHGPALAFAIDLSDVSSTLGVTLKASHPSDAEWVTIDRYKIKASEFAPPTEGVAGSDPKPSGESTRIADSLVGSVLGRLLRVQLTKGSKVKGKDTYRIKIINDSPLILNGMALAGNNEQTTNEPSVLTGLSLPPMKSLAVPASAEMVARLNVKKQGLRVLAADLSGL